MKRTLQALAVVCLLALSACAQGGNAYGSLSAATADCITNPCVVLQLPVNSSGVALDLDGTFSATLQFESQAAPGATWRAINVTPIASTTTTSSATAVGSWRVAVAGLNAIRVRPSAYVSGTVKVNITASPAAASLSGGSGGTPGGSNTDIQYNNAGSFGGVAGDAGAANNFLTGISSAGITKAQPTYANISGTPTITGGSNIVQKGNGAGGTSNSSITDDGTTVSTAEPIREANGSLAAPSFSFTNGTGSGLLWSATTANHPEMSTEGISSMTWFQTGTRIKQADNFSWTQDTTTTGSVGTVLSGATVGTLKVGNQAVDNSGNVDVATYKYRGLAQTYFVTSNFTTSGVGTALETITGLTFTFPASTAMNVRVDCNLLYSQAVGTAAVAFGFKDTTVAPTNLAASGIQYTSATASTEGTLAASSTTTATAITSATPSVVTTIWHAQLHLLIEQPSNASSSLFAIQASTATAADLVTVYRGSYCTLAQ